MNYTFRTLLAAAALLASGAVVAQDLIPAENAKGKWGYTDASGAQVIPFKYDAAEPFYEGMAKVKKGDKYGYIDANGQPVIDFKYQLIEPYPLREGYYKVAAGGKVKDGALEGEKYGFIDLYGNVVIRPEYEEIGAFSMGAAHVKKGDKYGYINSDLSFIVPCEYVAVGRFNADSVVWVSKGGSFDKANPQKVVGGKFGLYDIHGRTIIPVQYAEIGTMTPWISSYSDSDLKDKKYYDKKNLSEAGRPRWVVRTSFQHTLFNTIGEHMGYGYYMSTKYDGSKNGVINHDGTLIIPAGRYTWSYFPEENLAPISLNTGKMNYLDITTGQMLLSKPVSSAYSFQGGLAVVNDGTNYYMIDTTGKQVTPAYSYIYALKDGVYVVRKGEKYGLIGKDGSEIISPNYAGIMPPSYGLLAVQPTANGLMGYINTSGSFVIKPIYNNACSFALGYASVKGDNGWGAILPSGEEVVECRWNDIYTRSFENQRYVWVEGSDKLAHCYDTQTRTLAFPQGYTALRNFGLDFEGAAIVWQGKNKIGVVDTNGNEVIPTEMPDVDTARWAYGLIESGEIDAWRPVHSYRIKLKQDPRRNNGKLTDLISPSLWDF